MSHAALLTPYVHVRAGSNVLAARAPRGAKTIAVHDDYTQLVTDLGKTADKLTDLASEVRRRHESELRDGAEPNITDWLNLLMIQGDLVEKHMRALVANARGIPKASPASAGAGRAAERAAQTRRAEARC